MSRKTLFLSSALMVSLFAATALAQGQGRGMGMGGNQPQDMKTIHALFDDHNKITRTVKNISNGVETITESDDPKVKALIVEHSWAMKVRLEKKQPIRQWDPLFAELFKNSDKIKMELTNTAKGVKVTETSTDPYVVKLIQAHAAGVSEFVKEGMPSMHKEHPLPGEKKEEAAFVGKGDGVETCPVTGEPVNKEIKFGFFGRTVYFCCESCLEAAKKNPEKFIKP
jgi:YHS domain-containing protein